MAREPMEIAERFLDAYVSGEYEIAACELHAEAEWCNTPSFPGPTVVRGRDAIRDFWREMYRDFAGSFGGGSDSGMEVATVAELDDLVVAELHGWGGGTRSAAPFDRHWAHVFHLDEERIVRVETYGSYRRAREALEGGR